MLYKDLYKMLLLSKGEGYKQMGVYSGFRRHSAMLMDEVFTNLQDAWPDRKLSKEVGYIKAGHTFIYFLELKEESVVSYNWDAAYIDTASCLNCNNAPALERQIEARLN